MRYPQCRRTCSKISSQWGRPISSVTSYSNGAALPNLAPGSPTTKLALVSKLPLPWWSPGRSVHNWSQNCWRFTPLGSGRRGVTAGIRVRPLPTCCDCSCAAFPVVAAQESMSASSAGDSVGERLIYWSSRRGFMRDGRIHSDLANTTREAEAPRRCVHTEKGLSRPSAWTKATHPSYMLVGRKTNKKTTPGYKQVHVPQQVWYESLNWGRWATRISHSWDTRLKLKSRGGQHQILLTDVVAQVHIVPTSCLLKSTQIKWDNPVIMATMTTPSSYEEQWVPP